MMQSLKEVRETMLVQEGALPDTYFQREVERVNTIAFYLPGILSPKGWTFEKPCHRMLQFTQCIPTGHIYKPIRWRKFLLSRAETRVRLSTEEQLRFVLLLI